jgi:hypothetical protein
MIAFFKLLYSGGLIQNLLLSILSFAAGLFLAAKKDKPILSRQNAELLMEDFFKPHTTDIEQTLFKKIPPQNTTDAIQMLSSLNDEISEKKLSFYLSEGLLLWLNECIKLKESNTLLNRLYFIWCYYCFSRAYYKFMNQCRKQNGLPKRSLNYRFQHKLYYSPYLFWSVFVIKWIFILLLTLYIFILIFLISTNI